MTYRVSADVLAEIAAVRGEFEGGKNSKERIAQLLEDLLSNARPITGTVDLSNPDASDVNIPGMPDGVLISACYVRAQPMATGTPFIRRYPGYPSYLTLFSVLSTDPYDKTSILGWEVRLP